MPLTWQALSLQSTQAGGVENILVFFKDEGNEAITVFKRTMVEALGDPPAAFFTFLDKAFQNAQRIVQKRELPGLLMEALDDRLRARVQGAMLDQALPQASAPTVNKPKF